MVSSKWHKLKIGIIIFYSSHCIHLQMNRLFNRFFLVSFFFSSYHSFRAIELIEYSHITSSCWPNFNSCHFICCCVYRPGSNLSTTVEQVRLEFGTKLTFKLTSIFCLGLFFFLLLVAFVYFGLNWTYRQVKNINSI